MIRRLLPALLLPPGLFLAAGLTPARNAAAAAPTFVQTSQNRVTSGTTVSVTLPAAVGAGDLLVAYVLANGAPLSVTDDRGDTFHTAAGPTAWNPASNRNATVFYAAGAAGGATTVTANVAAVTTSAIIYVCEYNGVAQSLPLDGASTGTGTGSAMDSGAVTTSGAGDLLVAATASQNTVTVGASGFTTRNTTSGNLVQDNLAAAQGSYHWTGTQNGSAWVAQIVAFKDAPGVAPTSTPVQPTATSVPPTATPLPPTATAVLPTATSVSPTSTPAPGPTSTATSNCTTYQLTGHTYQVCRIG